jgi:hypothetical protein
MSISVSSARLDLKRFDANDRIRETGALDDALSHIRDVAASRAPILTGALRASGFTVSSGASGRIVFPLIYAAKQEHRDWQVHPHGGGAHYLGSAMDTEVGEAMRIIADRIFR